MNNQNQNEGGTNNPTSNALGGITGTNEDPGLERLNQASTESTNTTPNAETPPDNWQEAMKFFGMEYADVDSARQAFSKLGKYDEVHTDLQTSMAKIKDLESKVNLNPFANEFSEKVNALVQSGASIGEIVNFVTLQNIDPGSMSPRELIQMQMKHNNPNATPQEIKAAYDSKYGYADLEEGDSISAAQAYKEKEDANLALKFFQDQKVQVSKVEALEKRKAQEETLNRLNTEWSQWNGQNLLSDSTLNFTKEHFGVDLKFAIPIETKSAILRQVTAEAAAAGIELTQESIPQIQQYANKLVLRNHLPQILKSIVTQVTADVTKALAAESGNAEIKGGQGELNKGNPNAQGSGENKSYEDRVNEVVGDTTGGLL